MVNFPRSLFALVFVLGWLTACTSDSSGTDTRPETPETAPEPTTYRYQRDNFLDRKFEGKLGEQAVTATLTHYAPGLEGSLDLPRRRVRLTLEARVSFEGLVRGQTLGPSGPGSWKGMWITPHHFWGAYESMGATEAVELYLPGADDPFAASAAGFLRRETRCYRSDGAATGRLVWEIPAPGNWPPLAYWRGLETAFYRPECTCQGLESSGASEVRVRAILQAGQFRVLQQIDAQAPTTASYRMDRATGLVAPMD